MIECQSTASVRRKERKISQAKNKGKQRSYCKCKSVAEVGCSNETFCPMIELLGEVF